VRDTAKRVNLNDRGVGTRAVHTGERPERPAFVPTVTPIYPGSTYVYEDVEVMDSALAGDDTKFVYTRYGNPTTSALEAVIADLEGTHGAIAFSSGMAALHAAIITSVAPGSTILATRDLYGHTFASLRDYFTAWGVQTHLVDFLDLDATAEAIRTHRPDLIICETITNPLMKVTDIPAVCELASEIGATTLVDSTFTPPVLFQPASVGANLVVHSMTKYLAGHGDVTGGVVATSRLRRQQLSDHAKLSGSVLGPFEAWLALRGVKTLPLRYERQCANAMEIARALDEHPGVGLVNYPGLESHSGHETARRLFGGRGYGAMISFTIKDATREHVFDYLEALELIVPATSLGDIYSLSLYPAMSSHRSMPLEDRERIGIGDDLVRLSVGIEDPDDIIADLDQAISWARLSLD
jgi:cystathionine gamma-synthase/methionine-gamma-lyase